MRRRYCYIVITSECLGDDGTCTGCKWAVLENADFRADDLVAFVRNVVLRIVGLSAAMQRLGGRFPPVRRWEGDMVQLRVVPLCEAKVKKP